MPTLADMQAAVPKCPRVTHRLNGPHRRCGRTMRYIPGGNQWRCPECMQTAKGLMVAEWCEGLAEAA